MQPTLDTMIQFCAQLTDTLDDVTPVGGPYAGDALPIVNRFINAINYVKNKIARERFIPDYVEQITLPSTLVLDLTTLSKNLIKINKITDINDVEITTYNDYATMKIKLPLNSSGDILNIYYTYMPPDLVLLTDKLDFPDTIVDWKVLCFYAAYQYWLIEGGWENKHTASYYLNMYSDGFSNIQKNTLPFKRVRIKYGSD